MAVPDLDWEKYKAQTQADAAMKKFLADYGLEALTDRLWKYIVDNGIEDENQLALWVAQQPEYKARFPAMDALSQKGRAITPAQYVALERSYSQIMHEAGIPPAFFDKTTDFTALITSEVSPTELQARVQDGFQKVANADPRVRDQFRRYFGVEGDTALAAFFIDPKRALPKLEAAVQAAEVAGAAANATFTLGLDEADQLAKMGVTYERAMAGFEKMNANRDLFADSMGDQAVDVAGGARSDLRGFGPPAPLGVNYMQGDLGNSAGTLRPTSPTGGRGVAEGPPMGDAGSTDAATGLGIAYTFGTDGGVQTELARRLAQRRAAVGAEVQGTVIDRDGSGGLGSAD